MITFGPEGQHISLDLWVHSSFDRADIRVDVLRLDKIHPEISGNKWFKLKYFLEEAKDQNKQVLLSFGGAYSNHLLALAAAASMAGFASVGMIRGEEPPMLSPTLSAAQEYGMKLCFLSRSEYMRQKIAAACMELAKNETDPDSAVRYSEMGIGSGDEFGPGTLFIPEGGAGFAGVRGAEEILSLVPFTEYSHICCAVGTGTTLAGLINSSAPDQVKIGVSVLKGTEALGPMDLSWIKDHSKLNNVTIIHTDHFGGYAKMNAELILFMNELYRNSGIPTDFVYTAKLFHSIVRMATEKAFYPGSRILVLHSGGLQGNRSLQPGQLEF